MDKVTAVVKKELKDLFDQPSTYVLIIVFLAACSYFYFRVIYLNDFASVAPLFEFLPWVLMLFVPAFTMKSLASEKREGTLEILLTRPLADWQLLSGKILSNFIFIAIVLLLTLTIPFSLLLGGKIDFGIVAAQYFGGFLMILAFVSIGLFSSSITRNQTIAYILSIAVSFVFLVTGLDLVYSALPEPFAGHALTLSMQEHFKGITRGVVDFRDALYFISLSASFLFLTYVFLVRERFYRRGKTYQNIKQAVFILVIVIFAVNFFARNIVVRLDFTAEKIYSVSPKSIELARSLKQPVKVNIFVSSRLPREAEIVLGDAEYLLGGIAKRSNGKIIFSVKNVDKDEKAKFEANLAGIRPVSFNIISKDQFQIMQGFLGLTIESGKKSEIIPYIESINNFEYQLLTLISKITKEKKPKIGYLTGNQEKSLSSDYRLFQFEVSQHYDIEELSLNEGMKEIPDKYKVVVVGGPQRFVRQFEQELIGKFVKSGGSAFILMEGIEMDAEQRSVKRNMNAIMGSFLKDIGITVHDDLLHDLRSSENVSASDPNSFVTSYPPWLRTLVTTNNPVTTEIGSIMLPWASSIRVDTKKLKGVETMVLYSTSRFTKSENEPYNLSLNNELITEGKVKGLKSYKVAVAQKYPSGGRIIFVSDSDFIMDIFLRDYPENMAFALNAIDWLVQDSNFAAIRLKNPVPKKLLFESDSIRAGVKYGNIGGMPALIAIYGFIRLLKRRLKVQFVYETSSNNEQL